MRLENNLNNIGFVRDISLEQSVCTDLITSICGEHIGSGQFRDVFAYNLDSSYVVKIAPKDNSHNLTEYLLWEEIKGLCGNLDYIPKWFAPVKWISPSGHILIMKRTEKKDKPRPESIPKFFWDVKSDNFGWIGDKFVCHDYGFFHMMLDYKLGFKKAKW